MNQPDSQRASRLPPPTHLRAKHTQQRASTLWLPSGCYLGYVRTLLVAEASHVPDASPPNDELGRVINHTILARTDRPLRHRTAQARERPVARARVGVAPRAGACADCLRLEFGGVAVRRGAH